MGTLNHQFQWLKSGRTTGCQKEIFIPEIVDKIDGMILDNRRIVVRELAVSISTEHFTLIFRHEKLPRDGCVNCSHMTLSVTV